jgi:hypothetical protein
MNQLARIPVSDGLMDPIDMLLADIAIRIQLSATDYTKAEDRYRTINSHLERDGSLLQGHVVRLYPQGSMAIDATIASRLRTDEYDIDIIVELNLPPDVSPQLALDLLYHSIRGERGSRYYDMTVRRTRCVTVNYADDMHLDLTPVVLCAGQSARTSFLFHHRPEEPRTPGYRLLANPWGFADWFRQQTPVDHAFAVAFSKRAVAMDAQILAKAASEPVRPQKPAHEKSKAVIVLQLLKRWRNVQYDSRKGQRRPPSIMMSRLIADAANQTDTLFRELMFQAAYMRQVIHGADAAGGKVRVVNPRCPQDVLTDRWPESAGEQRVFLTDLDRLLVKLARLPESRLDEMRTILSELFGENPTGQAVESYVQRLGAGVASGRSLFMPGTGRVLTAASTAPAQAIPTRPHKFFGSDRV